MKTIQIKNIIIYLIMFDQQQFKKNTKKQQSFNLLSIVTAPKAQKKPPPKQIPKKTQQIHPYLKDNNLYQQKLTEFNEKLNQSKLTPQERAIRRDIKKAKESFIRLDQKGNEYRNKQPKRHKPQLIDLSEQKKTKKEVKTERKQLEYQQKFKQKQSPINLQKNNGNRYDPLQIKIKNKEPQTKKKEFKQNKRRQQSQEQQQDEEDGFIDQDDNDAQARRQLSKMFGKFKDEKYLKRDRQQIPIQSKVDDIFYENKFSAKVGLQQDRRELQILERQKKHKLIKKKNL